MKKITVFIFITIVFSMNSYTQSVKNQETINKALASETIKNQFEVLINKSNDFQGFKNIKHFNLNKFKINFLDSLKAFDKKYNLANTKISNQKAEIEKLKTEISTKDNNLSEISSEKDSINLFGYRMTKSSYNFLLWSIISGLLITTLLLLFKFKSSNSATKLAKSSFIEIENEFEEHKKKSLEREQVLRRKLQDEINKQRNA